MNSFTKHLTVAAAIMAAPGLAMAQSEPQLFEYTNGNLVLGIQATSGTGSNRNVFVDLGPATSFRDNGSQGVLGNIGQTLTAVYGSDWFTRSDVWFGVIGNLNSQPNSGVGSREPVDGDPSRTFYISRAASAPGAAGLIPAGTYPTAALGSAGTKFGGTKDMLRGISNGWNGTSPNLLARGLYAEEDGSAILDLSIPEHGVAWNNGWSTRNPFVQGGQGASYDVFTGGIQQSFAGAGDKKSVDVQRILSTNTGAVPTGVVGGGTYITTISIDSVGNIISESPAPTFPAFVDTSGDGMSDFLKEQLSEFGFEVGVAQPELVAQFLESQGFFTESTIQELVTAGQVMIQASGNNVNLALPVFKSDDLVDFVPAGNLELTIPKEGDKQFYRIQLGE